MKLIIIHIIVFSFSLVFSQTEVKLLKSTLKIGEQTELIYQITFPEKEGQLSFIPHQKTIPSIIFNENSSLNTEKISQLEIIKPFKDSIYKIKNQLTWIGKYTVCSWDTGVFILPSTTISTQDSVYSFKEITFSVTSPKLVEGKEIYDIKEQFVAVTTDYFSWVKSYWIFILIGILLILIILIYFKKKKKKELIPPKELSLKEKTLLAIDSLEKAKLWQKNQLKEHYIELSFILRSFLSSRYELNLLEKTSFETCFLLEKKLLEKDTIKTIKKLLDYSDLVKFAKSSPNEYEIFTNLAQVKQIVVETSPLKIDFVN